MTAAMLPDWRTRRAAQRWPLQPLLEVAGVPAQLLAEQTGFSKRTGQRWAEVGEVDDHLADLLATRIGSHPVLVWPDWY